MSIIFKQLFDEDSCTLTYLLADPLNGDAVIIDSVREHLGLYSTLLQSLELRLVWLLETHVHADHMTAAAGLKELTGARTVTGAKAGAPCADRLVDEGDTIVFGSEVIRVLPTPGHTPGCVSYRWRDRVFSGDALLIGGCGRTDFQGGDAGTLHDSIMGQLLSLPDETLVFPAHDYHGRRVSSVGQEKLTNQRLIGRSREAFVTLMNGLNLPKPRMIDEALPVNLRCGRGPEPLIDVQEA